MMTEALPSGEDSTIHLEDVFHHAALGIAVLDMTGTAVRVNPALEQMLGYSAEELRSMTFVDFSHPDDAQRSIELFTELAYRRIARYRIDKRYIRKDGSIVWCGLAVSLIRRGKDRLPFALAMVEDATERKQLEQTVERERTYFERLFTSSPDAITVVDSDDRIQRINPAFTRLFGYSEEEVIGRTVCELIVPTENRTEASAIRKAALSGSTTEVDTTRRAQSGDIINVSLTATPIQFSGGEVGIYGIYRDITSRKLTEAALERLSTIDELTGLLNRRGFFKLAERELKLARRAREERIVFCMDLDNFKAINDTYGHATGDRVLTAFADVLRKTFRQTDLVCRLGGDEFVALAITSHPHGARILCDRLLRGLADLQQVDTVETAIDVSIGVARYCPDAAPEIEPLLSRADAEMYEKKREAASRRDGRAA